MSRLLYAVPALIAASPAAVVRSAPAVPTPAPSVFAQAAAAPVVPARPAVDRPDRPATIIRQAEDGLFYAEATINHAAITLVVDSGSNVVILNQADAEAAGVGESDAVAVETAGGSSNMRRARIKQIVVAGQRLEGVDAVIVRKDLKVSLLGQSVLSRLASVTFKGDRLELQ